MVPNTDNFQWVIPNNLHHYAGAKNNFDNTKILKYPHFATTELHITSIDWYATLSPSILIPVFDQNTVYASVVTRYFLTLSPRTRLFSGR
jgi:hypothetical protein